MSSSHVESTWKWQKFWPKSRDKWHWTQYDDSTLVYHGACGWNFVVPPFQTSDRMPEMKHICKRCLRQVEKQ